MIFLDANIPMYLAGGIHANQVVARQILERAVADTEVLVTDAEVLQEILHRYSAIDRRHLINEAMDTILGLVDQVFPIERSDVELARDIVLGARLSARDAIHVAVMRRRGVDRIMSFDRGFDYVPGIVRIGS